MFEDTDIPTDAERDDYPLSMTLRAYDIAAEIRRRMPDVGAKKLHKLLYYCQGHHLADLGRPLFVESVSAWDMGPVVGRLWKAEKEHEEAGPALPLGQAELNTVGYVLSRYGKLSARDLERLSHAEDPWRRADEGRVPGDSAVIKREWIAQYFRAKDDDEGRISDAAVGQFVEGAFGRRAEPARPDTAEGILARAR